MSVALTAAVAIVGNPIINQPVTCVLTVSNPNADAVNVTSITPKVTPIGAPLYISPVFIPTGQAVVANPGVSQMAVSILGGASATFTFQVAVLGPAVQTGLPQQAANSFVVSAECLDSNGFVFSPIPQTLVLATPRFGAAGGSPPNVNPATHGGLQFNLGSNSALIL